jgi:hypothetical protein
MQIPLEHPKSTQMQSLSHHPYPCISPSPPQHQCCLLPANHIPHLMSMSCGVVFLRNFLLEPKWPRSSIWRCRKTGDDPQKDLAKSGYRPKMKFKSLIILLYIWLHAGNQILEACNFYYFFSRFWWKKSPKTLHLLILIGEILMVQPQMFFNNFFERWVKHLLDHKPKQIIVSSQVGQNQFTFFLHTTHNLLVLMFLFIALNYATLWDWVQKPLSLLSPLE